MAAKPSEIYYARGLGQRWPAQIPPQKFIGCPPGPQAISRQGHGLVGGCGCSEHPWNKDKPQESGCFNCPTELATKCKYLNVSRVEHNRDRRARKAAVK